MKNSKKSKLKFKKVPHKLFSAKEMAMIMGGTQSENQSELSEDQSELGYEAIGGKGTRLRGRPIGGSPPNPNY